MKNKIVNIHTDGGSRGNPGPAACAYVVHEGDREIFRESKFLGNKTNNYAEYFAVVIALEWLVNFSEVVEYSQINFYLDSELVVKQINKQYKIKDENLRKLYTRVIQLITTLNIKIVFMNIPREQNKEADLLVNNELDFNI